MALQVIETRTVEFHGDELLGARVVQDGAETVFVPVIRLCEVLGLDARAQRARIQRDEVLTEGGFILDLPSIKGEQGTYCLRYDLIPMWLTGVTVKAVRPELRLKLSAYRKEAAKVLAAYFLGNGIAVNEQRATVYDMRLKLAEMELERSRNEVAVTRTKATLRLMEKWGDDLRPEERRMLLLTSAGIEAPKEAWIEAEEIAKKVSEHVGATVNASFVGRVAKALHIQPEPWEEKNRWAIRQRTPAAHVDGKRVDQIVYTPEGATKLTQATIQVVESNLEAGRPAMSPKGLEMAS